MRIVAWIALALILPGCATVREVFRGPTDQVPIGLEPDPLYEQLFPRYVELCAVSQYRPTDKTLGGIPGHAVMYLKGACRDESAGYPRLAPCGRNETDRRSDLHGTGISVNRWFRNVNWVAIPGKDLFYEGNLNTYDVLDQAHYDAAVDEAVAKELYRGIEFHTMPGDDGPKPLREFVAIESIGTDFALRYGRSVFCTRLPVTEDQLVRSIAYLNELNETYWKGEDPYEWSGYADNCVHTLHNALAAAGIWKPKSVRDVKLRQMFNLAVPANTFVELAFLGNGYPIEDFDRIRKDEIQWTNLVEQDWLPAGPGVLMTTRAVHQENRLYDGKFRMFVLEGPFSASTRRRARTLLTDARVTALDANLMYFRKRYEAILADRVEGGRHAEERARYYAFIETMLKRVNRALGELKELDTLRADILDGAYEEWEQRAPAPVE